MFNKFDKYKEMSDELGKQIEIYKDSYETLEANISFPLNARTLSKLQKQLIKEFALFCEDEEIMDFENSSFSERTYNIARERIEGKISLLEEKKIYIDNLKNCYDELNTIKNGDELPERVMDDLKTKAAQKFNKGSEKYNRFLRKLVNEYREKKEIELNDSLEDSKRRYKEYKRKNNFKNVIAAPFLAGTVGLNNAYAKLHNINARLRKYKVANFVIKTALVLAPLLTFSVLGITAISLYGGALALAVYGSYKNVSNLASKRKIEILSYNHDKKSMNKNFKNYKISHFKSRISRNNKIYNRIIRRTPTEVPAHVDEPTPVEVPTHVDEPTPVEVPAHVDEPTPVEVPTHVDEPTPVEVPTSVEVPAPAEKASQKYNNMLKAYNNLLVKIEQSNINNFYQIKDDVGYCIKIYEFNDEQVENLKKVLSKKEKSLPTKEESNVLFHDIIDCILYEESNEIVRANVTEAIYKNDLNSKQIETIKKLLLEREKKLRKNQGKSK